MLTPLYCTGGQEINMAMGLHRQTRDLSGCVWRRLWCNLGTLIREVQQVCSPTLPRVQLDVTR